MVKGEGNYIILSINFKKIFYKLSIIEIFFILVASERDTRKLWRNIEPHLKKAMQTVYLREISR